MKLMALDLEMNQPSGKIIQVGWAIGDTDTGEMLEKDSALVHPGEVISDYIEALTGVTNERVREGNLSLPDAYRRVCEAYVRHQCGLNVITWGGGDSHVLRQQLIQSGVDMSTWPFGHRFTDVKCLYQMFRIAKGQKVQGGLAKAMNRMNIPFKGRKHDAADDAYNTLLLLFKFLDLYENLLSPLPKHN